MVRATYTVRQKLQIVIEATEDKAAVKGTARRHGVLPGQVRRWIKDRDELETAVQVNPRVRSLNKGCPRINAALEEELAAWIIDRRKQELAVTTNQVIAKAVAMDPSFRNGNRKSMWSWVYPFLHRHRLSIRRRTRVGQKLSGHLAEVRREFVETVNERFLPGGTMEGTSPALRVNMDETAVCFLDDIKHYN
ncbi:hypothetical protein PR001_g11556 [Phytophthora rubi]|uniref:HTH CENPB-type domain-containing protein n=1 Tax=Phytophthora rubi TaxID=129364 RepID=A0A6A3MGY1_9STRA|nr:hypothetical protein PR001_g11556 [Phytophthora rubi]